jgi:hypothetical protein
MHSIANFGLSLFQGGKFIEPNYVLRITKTEFERRGYYPGTQYYRKKSSGAIPISPAWHRATDLTTPVAKVIAVLPFLDGTISIQSVPGGRINILRGHSIGNSKQKIKYVHVYLFQKVSEIERCHCTVPKLLIR